MTDSYCEKLDIEEAIARFCARSAGHCLPGGMLHARAAPDLLRGMFSLDPVPENAPLFQGGSYESLLSHSPYVFTLDDPRHSFYERLRHYDGDWGFLFHSYGDVPGLHAHWRSLLTVRMPDGTGSHFRFYSAKVMAAFAPSCSNKELAELMGPCKAFYIPLEDASWMHVRNPHAGGEPDRPMPVPVPREGVWWQVRQPHLDAFAQALERIYRENIVDRLWEESSLLADEVERTHGSVGAFVDEVLNAARDYGFTQAEDIFSFIMLCLHYDWHRAPSPEHREALRNAATEPRTALSLLERTLLRSPHYG